MKFTTIAIALLGMATAAHALPFQVSDNYNAAPEESICTSGTWTTNGCL